MRLKSVGCAVVGHRWRPAADSFEAEAVLTCARCGRRQTISAENRRIEGVGGGRRVR